MPNPCADVDLLTAGQRDAYHEDGYVILRDFFPAKAVEEAAAEADALLGRADLISTKNLRCRWQPDVRTGECRFETFDPVVDIAPACGRLARGRQLFAVLAALYGDEACLFQDKLIYNPPGGNGS